MDITQMITDAISNEKLESSRGYIGASMIGKECNRAIWYDYKGAVKKPYSAIIKTTFEIGKRLEGLVLDYLALAGFDLMRPSIDNNYLAVSDPQVPEFQGHLDALMFMPSSHPVVIEIKTAKASSFHNFKDKGLYKWSEMYFAQIQAYLGMSGYKRAVIVVLNKDSSEIHHEWVAADACYYNMLKNRARGISTQKTPPNRINKNPIFVVCARCPFKETCFSKEVL